MTTTPTSAEAIAVVRRRAAYVTRHKSQRTDPNEAAALTLVADLAERTVKAENNGWKEMQAFTENARIRAALGQLEVRAKSLGSDDYGRGITEAVSMIRAALAYTREGDAG